MNSASLCSLAGRYENPIPTWFLVPIDFLKIPALATKAGGIDFFESIPGLLKSLEIPALMSGVDDWSSQAKTTSRYVKVSGKLSC